MRGGGRRDDTAGQRILDAAWDLLRTVGYPGLVDEVAERAGLARTTVYRRWPTKDHLAIAVAARMLGEVPIPGTGDLRAGLTGFATALAAVLVIVGGYATWTNLRPYTLQASIVINASPRQVRAILTDLNAYPRWNPSVISSQGRQRAGFTLTNQMRDSAGITTFTPVVLAVRPDRELRWIGKVGPGGIFDGEHTAPVRRRSRPPETGPRPRARPVPRSRPQSNRPLEHHPR